MAVGALAWCFRTCRMRASFDRHALRMVEASYCVADDIEEWIARVLDTARPLLDRGGGVQAYAYTIPRPGRVVPCSRVVETEGTPEGFSRASLDNTASVPRELVSELYYRVPAITTAVEHTRLDPFREHPGYQPLDTVARSGIRDVIGVVAYDPGGSGLMLTAASDRVLPRFGKRDVQRWGMLRAHLLTGLRLHSRVQRQRSPDAVIDPSGCVVHAERKARSSDAREALRRRALEIDRVRTRAGRREAGAALEVWKGLVEGTWTLVDSFESDGRRYYIAHRNDPKLTIPRPVSARERQVLAFAAIGYSNKQIAYALGLAASTVSSHLQSALRRLGVRELSTLASVFATSREGNT